MIRRLLQYTVVCVIPRTLAPNSRLTVAKIVILSSYGMNALVNRRRFMNERRLSANLYRPNDGCFRKTRMPSEVYMAVDDAREVSEEGRGARR